MTRVPALLAALALAGLAACASTPGDRSALIAPYTTELALHAEPYPFPYTAVHQRGGRKLGFVAATHTVDPASPTMQAIRQAFDRVRPAAVIVEGFPTEMGENPEAIAEIVAAADQPDADPYARGEAAFAARLAMDAGVPFLGGEPTEAVQTRALRAQGFGDRDIFFTDLLKVLPQSIRGGEVSGPADPGFANIFSRWTVSLAIERDDAPEITLDEFAAWYLGQYGLDYRVDARFAERADPSAETLVGRILRAQSLIRDRHLYGAILDTLKRRGRVLVVYGGSHRTSLAKALTASLGPAELHLGPAAPPLGAVAAGVVAPASSPTAP
jgi:hypothetical protein